MARKITHHPQQQTKGDLQDFIDYSVQRYDGFGRVLSRALKSPGARKAKHDE